MSYLKQIWRDLASGGTPLTADRLNHMEDGIAAANDAWDSVAPVLFATLPPARGTYAEASVPDISRYQWLYVLGLGEEQPTLLVPVPVFRAATGRRFHSTLPGGNAPGYEANIEYVSDTKIKYRVGTYITSMEIYGIGRA